MGEVVAIAAVGRNGVIGAGNDIPWRIPEDWARFKAVTMGQVLIMGRKTFDSIGRPLPGRRTIVVTRDEAWRNEGVTTAATVEQALADAARLAPEATVFVAGGGEIYRAAWPLIDRLEITEVDLEPTGDVTFPRIAAVDWVATGRDQREGFAFVGYRRRTGGAANDRSAGAEEGTRTLTPEGTGT
jgi:dihydrofolate reductase